MKKNSIVLILFYGFLVSLVFKSCPAKSEESSEFSYDDNSEKGPLHWGDLKPEWSLCKSGTAQSAINIDDAQVKVNPGLQALNVAYKTSQAILTKKGVHNLMLKWEGDAGSLNIGGVEYKLQQTHWHIPTEHSINAQRFAAELHVVHQSSGGQFAVIGILYNLGPPDPFLSSLEPQLQAIASGNEETVVGPYEPANINMDPGSYYRYAGSLTTPPCTENVVWTVIKKVSTATEAQINLLLQAIRPEPVGNARPLQALNGREVEVYQP